MALPSDQCNLYMTGMSYMLADDNSRVLLYGKETISSPVLYRSVRLVSEVGLIFGIKPVL